MYVSVETLRGFSFNGYVNDTNLPNTFQVLNDSQRDKGIRVTADKGNSIAVYGMNYKTVSTDSFLALPCTHLPVERYEYFGVSYYILQVGF